MTTGRINQVDAEPPGSTLLPKPQGCRIRCRWTQVLSTPYNVRHSGNPPTRRHQHPAIRSSTPERSSRVAAGARWRMGQRGHAHRVGLRFTPSNRKHSVQVGCARIAVPGNQCSPSGNTSRSSARGSAGDVASCQDDKYDYSRIQRVHEAFPFGARARPPSGSGGSLWAPGSESGSLETSICPCPSPQERSVHRFPMAWRPSPPRPGQSPGPRVGGPHGAPGLGELPRGALQVLGGGPPRSPRDTPSQAGLGACPGGLDGPPEGSGPIRLRPVPGCPPKVRCVGFFKGTLKVRPGRNRLAFQIPRQITH